MLSSRIPARYNWVLIVACGAFNCLLAALCIHVYVKTIGGDPVAFVEPFQRVLWKVKNSSRQGESRITDPVSFDNRGISGAPSLSKSRACLLTDP
jgi:hypothetical protein